MSATLDAQHETAHPLDRTAGLCIGWELYNGIPLNQIMFKELDQVFRHSPGVLKVLPGKG